MTRRRQRQQRPQSKPSLLPEEKGKRSTQPAQRIRPPQRRKKGRGCASIMLLLLTMFLSLVLVAVTAIVLYNPNLLGLEEERDLALTEISHQNTESALVLTSESLNAAAVFNAQQVLDVNSTISAFSIQRTQIARDAIATETAIANQNAQQATQSALEFQATQAEFDRLATQSELNYQSTQAYLNQNATAIALGFATAPAGSGELVDASPPPSPVFNEGFSSNVESGFWSLSAPSDWRLDEREQLIAQRNGAWIVTQRTDFDNYAVNVTFQPPIVAESYQYILLNTTESTGGLTLELYFSGGNLSAIGLYQITPNQINEATYLSAQNKNALHAIQTSIPIGDTVNVQVDIRNGRIGVFINASAIMEVTLTSMPPAGAVGAYLSESTRLEGIEVLP